MPKTTESGPSDSLLESCSEKEVLHEPVAIELRNIHSVSVNGDLLFEEEEAQKKTELASTEPEGLDCIAQMIREALLQLPKDACLNDRLLFQLSQANKVQVNVNLELALLEYVTRKISKKPDLPHIEKLLLTLMECEVSIEQTDKADLFFICVKAYIQENNCQHLVQLYRAFSELDLFKASFSQTAVEKKVEKTILKALEDYRSVFIRLIVSLFNICSGSEKNNEALSKLLQAMCIPEESSVQDLYSVLLIVYEQQVALLEKSARWFNKAFSSVKKERKLSAFQEQFSKVLGLKIADELQCITDKEKDEFSTPIDFGNFFFENEEIGKMFAAVTDQIQGDYTCSLEQRKLLCVFIRQLANKLGLLSELQKQSTQEDPLLAVMRNKPAADFHSRPKPKKIPMTNNAGFDSDGNKVRVSQVYVKPGLVSRETRQHLDVDTLDGGLLPTLDEGIATRSLADMAVMPWDASMESRTVVDSLLKKLITSVVEGATLSSVNALVVTTPTSDENWARLDSMLSQDSVKGSNMDMNTGADKTSVQSQGRRECLKNSKKLTEDCFLSPGDLTYVRQVLATYLTNNAAGESAFYYYVAGSLASDINNCSELRPLTRMHERFLKEFERRFGSMFERLRRNILDLMLYVPFFTRGSEDLQVIRAKRQKRKVLLDAQGVFVLGAFDAFVALRSVDSEKLKFVQNTAACITDRFFEENEQDKNNLMFAKKPFLWKKKRFSTLQPEESLIFKKVFVQYGLLYEYYPLQSPPPTFFQGIKQGFLYSDKSLYKLDIAIFKAGAYSSAKTVLRRAHEFFEKLSWFDLLRYRILMLPWGSESRLKELAEYLAFKRFRDDLSCLQQEWNSITISSDTSSGLLNLKEFVQSFLVLLKKTDSETLDMQWNNIPFESSGAILEALTEQVLSYKKFLDEYQDFHAKTVENTERYDQLSVEYQRWGSALTEVLQHLSESVAAGVPLSPSEKSENLSKDSMKLSAVPSIFSTGVEQPQISTTSELQCPDRLRRCVSF